MIKQSRKQKLLTVIAMKSIYKLAKQCKCISEERIEIDKNRIHYRNLLFTDYTVRGAINEYLNSVDDLCFALADKYPAISCELRQHKDSFSDEKMIHFTAMKAIVDSVLALEQETLKRIFISHSSQDRGVIERFVDSILLLGIGLSQEDIFCTSIEEMGIKNGEDMRNHIRSNVRSADFSLLMISKNYKASEICLNEMGAVWASDNRVRYYLLPGVDFKEIGWLCDVKMAERLYDSVALDSLEEELIAFYDLPQNGRAWSRQRQSFLDYLAKK